MTQNLIYALRTLRRNPATTAIAVATLALGIGANTALFSVINTVLLRPLSYPHPERIVELLRQYPDQKVWATTATKFAFWRDENHSFEATAAHSFLPIGLNLVGHGEPQRLTALGTTAGYFKVIGVEPMLGRSYSQAEDRPGAGKYAVLSFGLWQKLFHGDQKALGKNVTLSEESYQIIGIMPRGFAGPQAADLWVPMQVKIDPADISNNYPVIARLKPQVTLEMARADMQLVAERFRKTYGPDKMNDKESIGLLPFKDFLTQDAKTPLWILLAAVGVVLLIACANVANLLLVRSAARRREMAVRVAIGATNLQLIRQLLTESLLLAAAGAIGGCVLAASALPLLIRWAPADIPGLTGTAIDVRVLLYAFATAIVTGVVFGLIPALQSARLGIANPLREGSTRTTAGGAASNVRQALVIGEVAMTLLLLVGASLLIKTLRNLGQVRPGFEARNVLLMQMSLNDTYKDGSALAELNTRVTERLASSPEVVSVATAALPPLSRFMDLPFEVIGRPTSRDKMPDENYRVISQRYCATLKIPVLMGREFNEQDTAASTPVLLINQALAQKYFPHENPVGQQILVGRIIGPMFADKPRRIVGVVGDIRDAGLDQPAPPELFEPEAQVPAAMLRGLREFLPLNWFVRTVGNPMAVAEKIRREALTVAGDLPMANPRPLEEILSDSLARHKFMMMLLTVFAGLALMLGTVGLYGVISYSVAQRTRELGIRSALGAHRSDLLALVVGEGMRLAAIGLAIGVASSFALTRYLQSLLYGVSPSDPLVLTGVTAAMGMVAVAASFVPAWRAAQVDPLVALRDE